MIDGFSRKAQELNRKTEESVSGMETDPNASKQPIEKWFDLIHQMVPNPSKKDDISAILIDIIEDCRNGEPDVLGSADGELKPDYRAVYDCIWAALDGKYAKQLAPINAFVVVKLIEELKQLIKSDLNKNEMSFLKSGLWWQTPNQTNAQKPIGDIFKAINSQRKQQIKIESTENNTRSKGKAKKRQRDYRSGDDSEEEEGHEDLTEETEENTYETLKSFPKLRKIIECLNPLRVPVQLMAEEYNRL